VSLLSLAVPKLLLGFPGIRDQNQGFQIGGTRIDMFEEVLKLTKMVVAARIPKEVVGRDAGVESFPFKHEISISTINRELMITCSLKRVPAVVVGEE
jgi:hypothetical protein